MKKHLAYLTVTAYLMGISASAHANDFSIPFISAAGLGDLYADWATSASDASTSFSNPAGLTELHHQQFVFAPMGILGSAQFKGSSVTPTPPFPPFIPAGSISSSGVANTRIGAFFPSFYYSIPINCRWVFALFSTTPFGLGTNYGTDTVVRYLSTRSTVVVNDFGPSIGYKATDKISLGLGLDAARLAFTLNNMDASPLGFPDANAQNHLTGWAYGYHAGVLYQPLCDTRIGLSFNSMLMFHATGDSEAFTTTTEYRTTSQKSNAALPARTQLSVQHDFTPRWTGMATVFYTNWRSFPRVTLQNTMLNNGTLTREVIVFNYHNTVDYSIGANYKATEKWLLRGGVQFMNSPSNNQYRGVADPVGSAIILGLGARYTQNRCLSYDVGVGHSFFRQNNVNLTALNASGTPVTTVTGNMNAQTTVLGAQINWNIT